MSEVDLMKATATYHTLVNQTRSGRQMTKFNTTHIHQKMPAKFAALAVLTTGTWLRTKDIDKCFMDLKYTRSRGTIRRSLSRLVTFGFAEVKSLRDKHGRKAWKLTKRGLQYVNSSAAADAVAKKIPTPSLNPVPRPKKGASMCQDDSRPTFNKAVEDVVFEHTSKRATFSAYDITKVLRKKTQDGSAVIDIMEVGTVQAGGKTVAKVDHDQVKAVVHDLFRSGVLVGYDRSNSGGYWEYHPERDDNQDDDLGDDSPSPVSSSSYDGTPTL